MCELVRSVFKMFGPVKSRKEFLQVLLCPPKMANILLLEESHEK